MPRMTDGIKTGRFFVSLPDAETQEIDEYIKESGMYRACFLSYALTVGTRIIERQRTHVDVPQVTSQVSNSKNLLAVEPGDFSSADHHESIITRQKLVNQALEQIEPEQRSLLELLYFDGLSMSQIATRLGQPIAYIKALTIQAVQHLNSLLNEISASGR